MIHVLPFKPAHARLIARHVREHDREELRAGWGSDVWGTLSVGLADSSSAVTILYGTKPMCAAGIIPMEVLAGRYALWIVGTAEIDRHPFAFARASRIWLPRLIHGCSVVTNLVDKHDLRALKWERWLGAEFEPFMRNGSIDKRFWQFFFHGQGLECQQVA